MKKFILEINIINNKAIDELNEEFLFEQKTNIF